MATVEISGSGIHPLHDTPELWRRWQRLLSEDESVVFLKLQDMVPEDGGAYDEDPKMLARSMNMSQMRFWNAVKRLEKLGLVSLDED